MDRLTKIDGIGQNEIIKCFGCGLERAGAELEHCGYCEHWQSVLDRLAAYENTGLEPEEIGVAQKAMRSVLALACELQAYRALGPVEELTAWPKELWAVKPNPGSNEWNDEPENHIVHYIVHAFEPETGRYFVNTDNYPGRKQRHWINGKGLYKSRAEAEAASHAL